MVLIEISGFVSFIEVGVDFKIVDNDVFSVMIGLGMVIVVGVDFRLDNNELF